jgi:very-short-patch-repair endonuclease
MLDDLLRRHDGVITLAQARDAGLSHQAVMRRQKCGNWRRCGPGVYFVADRPFTDAARIRAAVWSYGSRAAASGLAAAWWHELTKYPPDIVEVTVPRNSNGRCHAGSRVRRRDLRPVDLQMCRGLLVTRLDLTTVEASVRQRGGAKIMDSALQQRVDLRSLWNAHLRNKGRYGSLAARILLQAAGDGAQSAAERLLIEILKSAGITGWKANMWVGGYRVDVGFAEAKVALEADGFAYHSGPEEFQKDRERQNALMLMGWQVLRFTWLDLTEYPDRVVAEIKRAISA